MFNRITVNVVPIDTGAVVKIKVEEKNYKQLRIGWHWDDEYSSEEFAELLDDNILGIGLESKIHAGYGPDRQDYNISSKVDRIFSTYITSRIKIFYNRLERNLFDDGINETGERKEEKKGLEITIGQQIARLGTVSAAITTENVTYKYTGTGIKEKFDLRCLTFESLVENLNRLPFPTSGSRSLIRVTFAGKFLGGDREYTKFYSTIESYFPIGKYINYRPKVALGISRAGLPPSEEFYLGGMDSFAGFRTNQLAGDKSFILSNEIRFKLPLMLYVIGRHDMGEVYKSTEQIKFRNLRHGLGLFVALDGPLGPLEFGYGIVDGDLDRYYLSIGFSF